MAQSFDHLSGALRRAASLERGIRSALRISQDSAEPAASRVNAALEALAGYDQLGAELYRLRGARDAGLAARQRLEEQASDLGLELVAGSHTAKSANSGYGRWLKRYRALWRREIPLLTFAVIFFLASVLVGFATALQKPEYVPVLVSQSIMEDILDQRAWFARIQENPLLFGAMIGWNNIRVAINCFFAGAILGLGGILLVCYNGVDFGAVFGFCFANGFDDKLGGFVVSHGFLELSIIVASGVASLVYGRVFFLRPYKGFAQRFMIAAREAGIMASGVVPWLLLAAFFEAFVSPFDYLPVWAKLIAGLALGLIFWGWTFWPERTSLNSRSEPIA